MIYAISDLHLCYGVDKPMDVFGENWSGYMEKLNTNLNSILKEDDTLLICGDISWATYIEQAEKDFSFINSLPGKKIICRGNHDYWFSTYKKVMEFMDEKGFSTIKILHNNSFEVEGYNIVGARGWDKNLDEKIYKRDIERLKLSINSVKNKKLPTIAITHFPPTNEIMQIFEKNGVKMCCYGHLHNMKSKYAKRHKNGIDYMLVACDCWEFYPCKLEVKKCNFINILKKYHKKIKSLFQCRAQKG